MLHTLIFSLFILSRSLVSEAMSSGVFVEKQGFQATEAHQQEEALPQQPFCSTNSCKVIPLDEKGIQILQEDSLKKVNELQDNKEIQAFQQTLFRNKGLVLEDKEFQEFVTELHEKLPNSLSTCQNAEKPTFVDPSNSPEGNFYIFVSFSLGEKALMNLAHEAQHYGATLVLRGFRDGSYAKTVQALQKIILKTNQGFTVDPELFTLFSISSVPTFVLTRSFPLNVFERTSTPLHDRMQGHVSIHYALETFSKEGDLRAEAQAFLETSLTDHSHEKGTAK